MLYTYDKDGRQDQLTLDKLCIKPNTIIEVFTQLMRLVLFQSSLVDTINVWAKNRGRLSKNALILQIPLMFPRPPELNRPFGLIFATGRSLTEPFSLNLDSLLAKNEFYCKGNKPIKLITS